MVDIDFGSCCIVIYILIWAITLYYYFKRRKFIDAGFVIISSYLLYAILSFFHYIDSNGLYKNITLFPFLYLYLMVMLFIAPVLKYDETKVTIQEPSKKAFNVVVGVYLFFSALYIPTVLPHMAEGIQKIMLDTAAGAELYNETMQDVENANMGHGSLAHLPAVISGLFGDMGIFFFFYYLTRKKKNKFLLYALFAAFITYPFVAIAESQRGPAIDRFFSILITYFAFRKFLSPQIEKRIRRAGLVLLIMIVVPLFAITVSRFDNEQYGVKSSVLEYSGMASLNFNEYAFDNNGIRYGDRTFPMFKRMLGFDNVPHNFFERRQKYPHLKIDDYVFIGFVGDFVLDYGPILAFVIFVLFYLYSYNHTLPIRGVIPFHRLLFLQFIMCVSMHGGMKLFSYADTGNLRIMALILVCIFFKIDYEQQKKQNKYIENE